ncbi:MAG: MBL fold metallo-hydrolase [Gordonia sp. (in: high G+C Gram-positive bacteria)]
MSTERRISEHVTILAGDRGGAYPAGNPLRVVGGGTTVLLDSAVDVDLAGVDLVLLSHYHEDHVAGVGPYGVLAAIHEFDAPAVRSWPEFGRYMQLPPGEWEQSLRRDFSWGEIDDVVTFGDETEFDVGGGVKVHTIPLPGHTGGHCGFFVEPDGVLYLADVDLSSFGPMYADLESELADVRATLETCRGFDAAVYAGFHHKGPYTDRDEYLAALDVHASAVDAREARLRELLAAGPLTVEGAVGRGVVYRLGGRRPWFADGVESTMCGLHLEELVERGVVVAESGWYELV